MKSRKLFSKIMLLSAILISGCINSKQFRYEDQYNDAILDYKKSGLKKIIKQNPNSELSDNARHQLNELNNKDYWGNDILFEPK